MIYGSNELRLTEQENLVDDLIDFRCGLLAVQDASYHLTRKGNAGQSKGQTLSVVLFNHRGLTRITLLFISIQESANGVQP